MESGRVILIVIIQILCALGIGAMGKNRRIGFGWALVASLFLGPLIGLIITLCSKRNETEFIDVEPKNTEK